MTRRRLRGLSFAAGLLLVGASAHAVAEDTRDLGDLYRALRSQKQGAAEHAEREKKLRGEAEALREEVARLRAQMIETAARLQAQEEKVSALEDRLSRLEVREKTLQRELERNENSAAMTLSALERIALRPPEAVIGRPVDSAVETIRTAMLLSAVVPTIQQDAADLRTKIEELKTTRARIEEDRKSLAGASRTLAVERQKLAALVEAKKDQEGDARAKAEKEAKRTKALAAKADDLRDLIRQLEKEAARKRAEAKARAAAQAKAAAEAAERARREAAKRPSLAALIPPPRPPAAAPPEAPLPDASAFAKLKGKVKLPARGEVVRWYGQKDNYGIRSRGITVATRPGAAVVAPVGGKVVFAGPFRDYGQLLIISPAAGYHVLLAGLGRIDAASGQTLLMGEPVGRMASAPGSAGGGAENAAVRSVGNKLRLYMEFRKNGDPIDPVSWLASSERKVSG